MLRFVSGVLVVCIGGVVLGAVVPGLFWLTVIALAALTGAGAVGLSLLEPLRPDDDTSVRTPRADLTVIGSRHGGGDAARISRAA
jgi:hypothetical protein